MVSVKKSAVGSPRDSRRGPNTPRLRKIAQISGNRTGRKVVIEITTVFRYSLLIRGTGLFETLGPGTPTKPIPLLSGFYCSGIFIYIYICMGFGVWGFWD